MTVPRSIISRLTLIAVIAMTSILSACDDNKQQHTLYKVVNTDTFADVPLYSHPDSDAIIATVPSRTECQMISRGHYGDGHTSQVAFEINGAFDTAYVPDKFIFSKDIDGTIETVDAFIVQASDDIGGKKTVIARSAPSARAKTVRTIKQDIYVDDVIASDNNFHLVRFFNGDSAWISSDHVFQTTRKVWVETPTAMQKLKGVHPNLDKIIETVESLQDSDTHYSTSKGWLKFKICLIALLFAGALFISISKSPDGGASFKWYFTALAVILGVALVYYEFVNAIIMGDGFMPTFSSLEQLNSQSLGWVLNLLITIIGGILYFIMAVIVLIAAIVIQQLIAPAIGVSVTGASHASLVCNIATMAIFYIGFIVGWLAGPQYYTVCAWVSVGCAYIPIVISIIIGYRHRNYFAILALALPFVYAISLCTTYFIAKSLIFIAGALAVIFFAVGAAGNRSKFQSQGSGRSFGVRNQAGQTIGIIDNDGWHDR